MRIECDTPLDFDRSRCEICGRNDDDWYVMHFLSDGAWRTLKSGQTLREQGIDELDTSRLYCIHACTQSTISKCVSMSDIDSLLATVRNGAFRPGPQSP